MKPTMEDIKNLQAELEPWFRSNGFLRGIVWRTIDERRYENDTQQLNQTYIKLIYVDSEFSDIMSGLPTAEPMHSKWLNLYEEFDAILSKRDFWFERINDTSLNIYSRDQDGTDE